MAARAAGCASTSPRNREAPKRRKIVDRRASKGRRLRFHVHEKLVNFMAPAADARSAGAGNGVGAALFANLFGRQQQPKQPPAAPAALA